MSTKPEEDQWQPNTAKRTSNKGWMLNYIGLGLIICGFIAPYLRGVQISWFFFWIGFLIILSPANPFLKTFAWRKWARIGVLLNIGIFMVFFVLVELEYYNYSWFNKLSIIMNPIGPVMHFLFPIRLPVEKIVFGSFRSTITIFLSLLIYIGLAVLIGKMLKIKQQRENASTSA